MAMDMAARAMAKQAEQKAVNQVSTKTTAADKRIFSLPNAADGSLSIEGVKGKTVQNLLGAGLSTTSTGTGYTPTSDGYAKILGLGAYDTLINLSKIPYKPSTEYTVVIEVKTNTWSKGLDIISGTSTPYNNVYRPIVPAGTTGIFKGKITTKADFTGVLYGLWLWHDSTVTGDLEARLMILEGDWTNKEIPPYFEGIKSVGEDTGKLSVKSTGKNLLDNSKLKNIEISASDGKETNVMRVLTSDYIRIFNGYTYKDSFKKLTQNATGSTLTFRYYDINKNYIGIERTSNSAWVRLRYLNTELNISPSDISIQYELEKENPYEPYKESKIEIPLTEPLRSLPNGVSDEIKDGKIIRRVGKYELTGYEYWNFKMNSQGTHGCFYIGRESSPSLKLPISTNGNNDLGISTHFPWVANRDVYSNRNTPSIAYYSDTSAAFMFISTIKTLEEWKTWIRQQMVAGTPVTLVYQLATPTEEPITIPAINSFTNGMVTVENNLWPSELTVSYSTNVVARVITAESTLSGVLASALTLADKELAMKSIPSLATAATLPDTVAKINQILTIWR